MTWLSSQPGRRDITGRFRLAGVHYRYPVPDPAQLRIDDAVRRREPDVGRQPDGSREYGMVLKCYGRWILDNSPDAGARMRYVWKWPKG